VLGKKSRMAAFGIVAVGCAAVVTACAPVKMGAAATVGNQRITLSSVDSQVANLQVAAKPYGAQVPVTQSQMPDAVLSWLIRFAVRDQMAATAGITVTQSQVQQAVAEISSEAQQAAAAGQIPSGGVNALLVYNGLPPDLLNDLGRYQAQEIAFVEKNNGGKLPTSQTAITAAQTQVSKADCQASKALNIQVSPQFGRLDYSQFTVVTGAQTLSRPAGAASPAATSGATPAC
jgi:SurA-like protein